MDSQRNTAPERDDAHRINLLDLERRLDRLKSSMHLAVIFGGDKSTSGSVIYQSHNTRAWKSYEAVANDIESALRRLGFRHVEVMPEDMRLGDRLRRRGIHMGWLNTGGVQGHNPVTHAPSMLEMLGLPYVGHDPLAATLLDNKHVFKRAAVCAGLPTARFMVSHRSRGLAPDFERAFEREFNGYGGPFVVKPVSGRASLHVHVVSDTQSLRDAVDEVQEITQNAVLIEQYLPGREVCVAVSGPVIARNGQIMRGGEPTVFSALERALMPGEQIFTSMDHRPITQARTKFLDGGCDAKLRDDLSRLARQTYLAFDLNSLIRLDLRADQRGELHILEANPKPDLKAPSDACTSLICAGLGEIGLDYDDLIFSLLADRLDYLFTRRPETVRHLFELIETRTLFDFMQAPLASADGASPVAASIAELKVAGLGAGRHGNEAGADNSASPVARARDANAA
ncbi:MAG: ATP-grasp domain-containing protein [Alphaproteobacteria bacterium]|nr:ATP-grasp domain-containing protein [Alphaproteobacteria bacterium]